MRVKPYNDGTGDIIGMPPTRISNDRVHAAYKVALAADNAFSAELVRVYGARAGDARYQYKHSDAKVITARDAKVAADAVLAAALEDARG